MLDYAFKHQTRNTILSFCTILLTLVGRVATSYDGHGLVLIDANNVNQ